MAETYEREEHPVELLPWLANGTLEGEERERVQRHVEGCARCRAELEFLQA
ncbi:MAG TPA: zf-HC2 domain-containing protein, partial [Chromatiales bacterium]|nr:zf-HC2 domain-containing protein [Chromatiales bacterium]